MKKDDLIKIFVFAIVAFFLFELFAFQGSGRYAGDGGEETPTPAQPGNATFFGTAVTEGTVLAYPDNILIISGSGAGSDPALLGRLNTLVREGRVAYVNSDGQDSVNAILSPDADITAVAENITLDFPGITTAARAQVGLPQNITFRTAAGNFTTGVARKPYIAIEPLMPAGGNITLLLGAMVDPQGAGVSDFDARVAETGGTVPLNLTVESVQPGFISRATYNWEGRDIDGAALEAALKGRYPNSTFAYHSNPFVLLTSNATEDEQAGLKNLTYVIIVAGTNVLVDGTFTNRSRAEEDFSAILNSSSRYTFPQSYVEFNASEGEADEAFLNSTFAGANETEAVRLGNVAVPDVLEIEGTRYLFPGGALLTRFLPPNTTAGQGIEIPVDVKITGARITSLG